MSDKNALAHGKRLDSWKEIAVFFGRNERTVNRWEKERALPVHRMPGGERGRVFAYVEELTAWLQSADFQEEHDATTSPDTEPTTAAAKSKLKDLSTLGLPPEPGPPPAPLSASTSSWFRRHSAALGAIALLGLVLLCLAVYQEAARSSSARPGAVASANAASPARAEAEELYLQGRYHWDKRTGPDLTQSLDDFTRATQIDPTFAKGYAGIADTYNLLREYTDMPGSQAFPLAIANAKKAVALDDSLAEGHRALAFADFYWNWDGPGSEREFRRAIALDPKDAEAHHWYATSLSAMSRHPEALAEIEVARKLNPASSSIAADRAQLLANAGQTDQAIAVLQELENADPSFHSSHAYLAGIYFSQRQFDPWLDEREKIAVLCHDQRSLDQVAELRAQLHSGGPQPMLELLLQDQRQDYREGRTGAFMIADTLAILGRNKEAIDYLEKAYQRHEYVLMSMGTWGSFRTLHGDPKFENLLRRVQWQPQPYPS